MKVWLRWLLIITQVGGGLIGILMTLGYLLISSELPPFVQVISLGFVALYAFVAIAGMNFARDEQRTRMLRLALWLQVPLISSPIFTWLFSAGMYLYVALMGSKLSVDFWLGSKWQLNLYSNPPWGFGVNLFALWMLILLRGKQIPQSETSPSITPPPELGKGIPI